MAKIAPRNFVLTKNIVSARAASPNWGFRHNPASAGKTKSIVFYSRRRPAKITLPVLSCLGND